MAKFIRTCNSTDFRFLNKNRNENERKLIDNWVNEITRLYGTSISYFRHGYALSAHDSIYGENPTAPFEMPMQMIAIAELNNDALLLSKFGVQSESDLKVLIPIKEFAIAYKQPLYYPRAGDLIRLDELGFDRPGGGGYPNSYPSTQLSGMSSMDMCEYIQYGDDLKSTENGYLSGNGYNPWDSWLRGPNVFEITEATDERLPQGLNPLLTHSVWLLNCKRFDYSYEPNAPREHGANQVYDNTFAGKLSGGTETTEPLKKYIQDVSKEAKKSWDYEQNGTNDNVYGDY